MTHCLVGKTIEKIEIASDKRAIRFTLSNNIFIVAKADGDCCSNSWIENIEFGELPARVLSINDIDLPGSCDNHPEHNCLAVYGLEILTDKGNITIDYRNSSNGYYGGNLSWPDDSFYGGVFGQNMSSEEWESV